MKNKNDFSQGKISANIMKLALPMTLAQLINVLYNVVDRMFIGRIPNTESLALTGVGITFPIVAIVIAFSNLFSVGGAPLSSIARGKGDINLAEKIMGNCFSLLVVSGIMLTGLILIVKKPLLYLFGASESTYPFANSYITIYILGTVFVTVSLGMNSFINSQGFGKVGMTTILLGAIVNLALDPIFIFTLNMGVYGAALSSVIAQFLSAFYVFKFLTSDKAILKIKLNNLKVEFKLFKQIFTLGLSGFIMAITNSIVQVICNVTLQIYGGDLYVGIMTVLNSIREIITMPVQGITMAAQPVIGFNFGAKKYDRVKSAIKFMSITCVIYTTFVWGILRVFPEAFIRLFNNDPSLIQYGVPSLNLYYFGFFFMSLQFSGQSTYIALGKSKHAIFFSLLRKVIIVVPLTIILPRMFDLGVNGVFLSEPISNLLGGVACYATMIFTIWKPLTSASLNSDDELQDTLEAS